MGVMKSCMDGSNPIMKLLCGGGGGGKQCQTDADCPSGQKCNSLLPGVIPGTCQ
jgi:Cys-rich repeat protein